MDEDEIRRLIQEEVTRQLSPVMAAFAEFTRKANIGLRTMANGVAELGQAPIATTQCTRCGKPVQVMRDPKSGGQTGNCTACGYRWSIY